MAKSGIRQWTERLIFRAERKQTHDAPAARQRDNDADTTVAAPAAQGVLEQEVGYRSERGALRSEVRCQSNFHPPAFPPAWACEWGEDQYGLYADLQIPRSQAGVLEPDLKQLRQRFRWIAPGSL
ncbi:MAG: hypothetical protein WGN25_11200 [Candidatus Electrothrix sp. GW3-4]|uniref:hypothetical protein n=1 Tax=Candidatus Electrothrix sp. GW3-4 TaxID=3126740 RepID=UPI0030D2343D